MQDSYVYICLDSVLQEEKEKTSQFKNPTFRNSFRPILNGMRWLFFGAALFPQVSHVLLPSISKIPISLWVKFADVGAQLLSVKRSTFYLPIDLHISKPSFIRCWLSTSPSYDCPRLSTDERLAFCLDIVGDG